MHSAASERKAAYLMCPKDDNDAQEMRISFSDNMLKAWRELDIRSEVSMLDDCHTFGMSTDIRNQKSSTHRNCWPPWTPLSAAKTSGEILQNALSSSSTTKCTQQQSNARQRTSCVLKTTTTQKRCESLSQKTCSKHGESSTTAAKYTCWTTVTPST